MVITEDRERGTIRALRETQKGGELPLMTIYTHTQNLRKLPIHRHTAAD